MLWCRDRSLQPRPHTRSWSRAWACCQQTRAPCSISSSSLVESDRPSRVAATSWREEKRREAPPVGRSEGLSSRVAVLVLRRHEFSGSSLFRFMTHRNINQVCQEPPIQRLEPGGSGFFVRSGRVSVQDERGGPYAKYRLTPTTKAIPGIEIPAFAGCFVARIP